MSLNSTLAKYMVVIDAFNKSKDHILTAYDSKLEILGVSTRQISRILDELQNQFDQIVRLENTRPIQYKLLKPIDLLNEAFDNSDDLGWLYELVKEKDPEAFGKLGKYSKYNDHIYQFQNTPFEELGSIETKKSFNQLKTAVKNREYRTITFSDNKTFHDVKCLKLLFLEGNWYIAYVPADDGLRLGRISFIKSVSYSKKESSYQPKSVLKQMTFLKQTLQNPFTLYNKEIQTATLKALPKIAQYFDKGMKPFFSSQKYIKKLDDGSILFEVSFTQPMEILPFLQKWMPDLVILSPATLQNEYIKKLQKAVSIYTDNRRQTC